MCLFFFRVNCGTFNLQQSQQITLNGSVFMTRFSNLQFNTQYSCCVHAVYADTTENAFSCAVGQTERSLGKLYNLCVHSCMYSAWYFNSGRGTFWVKCCSFKISLQHCPTHMELTSKKPAQWYMHIYTTSM